MHTLPEDGTPAMPDGDGDGGGTPPGQQGTPDEATRRRRRTSPSS